MHRDNHDVEECGTGFQCSERSFRDHRCLTVVSICDRYAAAGPRRQKQPGYADRHEGLPGRHDEASIGLESKSRVECAAPNTMVEAS